MFFFIKKKKIINSKWTFECDRSGNDLRVVKVTGARCGPACFRDEDCTHFVWNNKDGSDKCFLKKGIVTWDDFQNRKAPGGATFICGIPEAIETKVCDANKCQNRGRCQEEGNDVYSCLCPSGFTGPNCGCK